MKTNGSSYKIYLERRVDNIINNKNKKTNVVEISGDDKTIIIT